MGIFQTQRLHVSIDGDTILFVACRKGKYSFKQPTPYALWKTPDPPSPITPSPAKLHTPNKMRPYFQPHFAVCGQASEREQTHYCVCGVLAHGPPKLSPSPVLHCAPQVLQSQNPDFLGLPLVRIGYTNATPDPHQGKVLALCALRAHCARRGWDTHPRIPITCLVARRSSKAHR